MYYYRITTVSSLLILYSVTVFSAQALLAGMPPDGPAFLAPRYLGQETRGKREFRACWPSFWAFCSWILVLVLGVLVLCVAGIRSSRSTLDSRRARPTIVSPLVACLRVVAECFKGWFKGCFVGGSVQVIEDILSSERDGGGGSSVLREASESKVTKRRK